MTLPHDVCDALAALDSDLSRAIVRIVMARGDKPSPGTLEVAAFGSRAVIVVTPTPALSALKGVELVPLADGRALIAIDDRMPEAQFELEVADALHDGSLDESDRALFEQLAAVLREARSSGAVVLRRIIVLQASKRLADGGKAGTRRSKRQ